MRFSIDDINHRVGIFIIPVIIKRMNNIIYSRANQHDIDIGKLIIITAVIVLIGHVAAPNQRNLIISNKAFIMHAPINAL